MPAPMLTPLHVLLGIVAGIVLGVLVALRFALFTLESMTESAAGRSNFGGARFRCISRNFIVTIAAQSRIAHWVRPDAMERAMMAELERLAALDARNKLPES